MLDYLIDQDEDRLGGDLNFCNYYEDADTMLNRIASIVEGPEGCQNNSLDPFSSYDH